MRDVDVPLEAVFSEAEDDGEDRERGASEPAFGDPRAVVLRWEIPSDHGGMRADRYLVAKIKRLSRHKAQRLIREGDFRSAQGPLKPSARLRAGLAVELWRIPPDDPRGPKTAPVVLFEDARLLVVDKPGDLAVHPSARYLYETLTHWLRLSAGVGQAPAHPCHRLDRETSGVLVCAKDTATERAVKRAFMERGCDKLYLAVVDGRVDSAFVIDAPLGLQGLRGLVRIRMIEDPSGLPSVTHVHPLIVDAERARTLVACRPLTGRQHQIRAHLSIAGHPIVGDKLYAMGDGFFDAYTRGEADESELAWSRQALHAYALAFELDGARQRFVAPLPEGFRTLVDGIDEGALLRALSWWESRRGP